MTHRLDAQDFHRIFESCPGLYLILCPDWTIAAVSNAYLQATMTRREQILGRHVFEVFPDNPADTHANGVAKLRASLERALRDRRPDTMPVQRYDIRRTDGSFEERFWCPLNTPVLDEQGQVQFIIHRVEDVTDYVRLQMSEQSSQAQVQDLQSRTMRMEADIFARAKDLARANDELRHTHAALAEAQAAKDALTGMIIHDIRNPLAACLGHIEMALEKAQRNDAALLRHLEGARQASTQIQTLVDGILDINRMEDGHMPITMADVDIHRLITDKVGQYQGAAAKGGIVLLLDEVAPIRHITDEALLGRVLDNLLTNAIKHTPAGGSVLIAAGPCPGGVTISISDTGEGIAGAQLGRLFTRYGRIDGQLMGRSNDTGLGLAFCRMAIGLLHGSITVDSTPDQGTSFTISLLRNPPHADDPAATP
jgi:signal transduction histidine kinase